VIYFKFEISIQGLPSIPPNDPRYAEPFFAFRVIDQAGNPFAMEESYAQFMAPGDKRIVAGRLADIEVKHLSVDVPGQTKLAFHVISKPNPITQLANGRPPILLRVLSYARNVKQLAWVTNIPANVRPSQPQTIILRDDKPIGISFESQYRDEQVPTNHEPTYRVEQIGRDGQLYSSNTAKAAPLKLEILRPERGSVQLESVQIAFSKDFEDLQNWKTTKIPKFPNGGLSYPIFRIDEDEWRLLCFLKFNNSSNDTVEFVQEFKIAFDEADMLDHKSITKVSPRERNYLWLYHTLRTWLPGNYSLEISDDRGPMAIIYFSLHY